MRTKAELKYIHTILNDLQATSRTMKDVFLSNFLEKDKIMFTEYRSTGRVDLTYGEIENAIYGAAESIVSHTKGLGRGKWVAIQAENKVVWVIAFWATLLAGYKAFLLNPSHSKQVNMTTIGHLDIDLVVGDAPFGDIDFLEIGLKKQSFNSPDFSNFADEIALSSSGSSSVPKVAVYSGRKVIENLINYDYVIAKDNDFIRHGGQQHSQLVILPFYHIFGFSLVFMWYSFSHSRFVIPRDLSVASVRPILDKEGVKMILSVPLFFELVYSKLESAAEAQGKFNKLHSLLSFNNRIQEKFPRLGPWVVRNITARGLRKKTLGPSVVVLGIGGAKMSSNAVFALNGLGYRAINGYGTTELSIFLAAFGCGVKALNEGTIGNDPWRGEYRFGEGGELSLKIPNCCDYVIENGIKRALDDNSFIPTGDIGHERNGYLYIDAREDDLLVLPSGEKVYPNHLESYFEFLGPNRYRVLSSKGKIVLIFYCDESQSNEDVYRNYLKIKEANKGISSSFRVQEIRKTAVPLPLSLKQEVSRPELRRMLESSPKDYPFVSAADAKLSQASSVDPELLELVKKEVAEILGIKDIREIDDDADFFADLGGDSMSYMELSSRLAASSSFDGDKARALSSTSIKEIASLCKRYYN